MRNIFTIIGFGLISAMFFGAGAVPGAGGAGAAGGGRQVVDREWMINGVKRTGIVELPAAGVTKPANGWPVVFLFHGHGGKDTQIMRQFRIGDSWPAAMVVSLQGLPTVGQLTDPSGEKAGWDVVTAAAKNKDLAFFDAALATVKKEYPVDTTKIFATGTSNGGGMTYFLWAMRGDTFAAVAPSSSAMGRDLEKLTPKPVMVLSGKEDPLVKFQWQERMAAFVQKLDQVTGEGKAWPAGGKDALWYDSALKMPVVTVFHEGGHPPPADVGARVTAFFKAVSGE
jgi:polyhydroxybutyrate depolymerase